MSNKRYNYRLMAITIKQQFFLNIGYNNTHNLKIINNQGHLINFYPENDYFFKESYFLKPKLRIQVNIKNFPIKAFETAIIIKVYYKFKNNTK